MYTNVISMPNLELLNHYIVINVCRQAIHMSFKTRTTKSNPLIFFKHSRPCKPMGNPVIDAIFLCKRYHAIYVYLPDVLALVLP